MTFAIPFIVWQCGTTQVIPIFTETTNTLCHVRKDSQAKARGPVAALPPPAFNNLLLSLNISPP